MDKTFENKILDRTKYRESAELDIYNPSTQEAEPIIKISGANLLDGTLFDNLESSNISLYKLNLSPTATSYDLPYEVYENMDENFFIDKFKNSTSIVPELILSKSNSLEINNARLKYPEHNGYSNMNVLTIKSNPIENTCMNYLKIPVDLRKFSKGDFILSFCTFESVYEGRDAINTKNPDYFNTILHRTAWYPGHTQLYDEFYGNMFIYLNLPGKWQSPVTPDYSKNRNEFIVVDTYNTTYSNKYGKLWHNDETFKYHSYKFHIDRSYYRFSKDKVDDAYILIGIPCMYDIDFSITDLKLEEGNIPTSWSISNNDILNIQKSIASTMSNNKKIPEPIQYLSAYFQMPSVIDDTVPDYELTLSSYNPIDTIKLKYILDPNDKSNDGVLVFLTTDLSYVKNLNQTPVPDFFTDDKLCDFLTFSELDADLSNKINSYYELNNMIILGNFKTIKSKYYTLSDLPLHSYIKSKMQDPTDSIFGNDEVPLFLIVLPYDKNGIIHVSKSFLYRTLKYDPTIRSFTDANMRDVLIGGSDGIISIDSEFPKSTIAPISNFKFNTLKNAPDNLSSVLKNHIYDVNKSEISPIRYVFSGICLMKNDKIQYYVNPDNIFEKLNGDKSDVESGNDGEVFVELSVNYIHYSTYDNDTNTNTIYSPKMNFRDNRVYVGMFDLSLNEVNGCKYLMSLYGKTPFIDLNFFINEFQKYGLRTRYEIMEKFKELSINPNTTRIMDVIDYNFIYANYIIYYHEFLYAPFTLDEINKTLKNKNINRKIFENYTGMGMDLFYLLKDSGFEDLNNIDYMLGIDQLFSGYPKLCIGHTNGIKGRSYSISNNNLNNVSSLNSSRYSLFNLELNRYDFNISRSSIYVNCLKSENHNSQTLYSYLGYNPIRILQSSQFPKDIGKMNEPKMKILISPSMIQSMKATLRNISMIEDGAIFDFKFNPFEFEDVMDLIDRGDSIRCFVKSKHIPHIYEGFNL